MWKGTFLSLPAFGGVNLILFLSFFSFVFLSDRVITHVDDIISYDLWRRQVQGLVGKSYRNVPIIVCK